MAEPSPWIPTDEVYEALGRVAAGFSQLDETLSAAITGMLRLPSETVEAAPFILTQLSFSTKLKVADDIVQNVAACSNHRRQMKGLVAPLRKANDRRNQLMHSVWFGPSNLGPTVRLRLGREQGTSQDHFTLRPEDPAAIKAFADELGVLTKRLINLMGFTFESTEQP